MLNVNSELDFEKAEEIAMEFDRLVEMEEQVDVIEELLKEEEEDETDMIVRPPVVCVMGHVDMVKLLYLTRSVLLMLQQEKQVVSHSILELMLLKHPMERSHS